MSTKTKPKNDNPTRWQTMARSYIEEGADSLMRAAADILYYLRKDLSEWALTDAMRRANNAMATIRWGESQLNQTLITDHEEVEEVKEKQ